MKILGISGGAKNGRNDCMCKEALMGAAQEGAEVEFIHLLDLDIRYCEGCMACNAQTARGISNKCVIKDDLDWLMDKMLDADGIMFSMPIFDKCAPAFFHSLMDRLGPRYDTGINTIAAQIAKENGRQWDQRIFKKKAVSFIAIGGSDWMTGIQNDSSLLAASFMWTVVENEVFSWAANILMDDERVGKVHQMGVNLAKAAADPENASYKSDPGICSHCNSRLFYFSPDGKAICASCGIEGRIISRDGKTVFEYPEDQIEHAHDTMAGKMKHGADIGRNTAAALETMKTEEYKLRLKKYKEFISPTAVS